ncbi:ATP-binding protein [Bacillus sp. YC2]|nr:ATP-binding protein [Bacillus sp. YC2]
MGQATTSDSNVTNEYVCDGCGENVREFTTVIALGPMAGKEVSSKIGCNCSVYQKVKDEQKEADNARMKRIFAENSILNKKLQNANFKTYSREFFPQAYDRAVQYAKSFDLNDPKNLLFTGSFGTGKSHLSVSISKAVVAMGFSSIFISLPKMYTKIRSTYNKDSDISEDRLMDMLYQVDLLILDDIGAEGEANAWSMSKAFEIIDQRSGKHNIYTTNLSASDFQTTKDRQRIFSRMMEDTEPPIVMDGPDYRKRQFYKGEQA